MITGGCLCGAVRFKSDAEPLATRVCWCRDCQKVGAGSGTVNAVFPAEALSIEGEIAEFESLADSGNRMSRRFCPKCGTSLFSQSSARPQFLVVRVGALDDPEKAAPTAAIWVKSAPRWACIDPDMPRFDTQPPPA